MADGVPLSEAALRRLRRQRRRAAALGAAQVVGGGVGLLAGGYQSEYARPVSTALGTHQLARGGGGSDDFVDVRWHVVTALRCLAETLELQGFLEVQGQKDAGTETAEAKVPPWCGYAWHEDISAQSAGCAGCAATSGLAGDSVPVLGTPTRAGSVGRAAAGNDEFDTQVVGSYVESGAEGHGHGANDHGAPGDRGGSLGAIAAGGLGSGEVGAINPGSSNPGGSDEECLPALVAAETSVGETGVAEGWWKSTRATEVADGRGFLPGATEEAATTADDEQELQNAEPSYAACVAEAGNRDSAKGCEEADGVASVCGPGFSLTIPVADTQVKCVVEEVVGSDAEFFEDAESAMSVCEDSCGSGVGSCRSSPRPDIFEVSGTVAAGSLGDGEVGAINFRRRVPPSTGSG